MGILFTISIEYLSRQFPLFRPRDHNYCIDLNQTVGQLLLLTLNMPFLSLIYIIVLLSQTYRKSTYNQTFSE